MRYNIGEIIPVIAIVYANVPNGRNLMFHPYRPWIDATIDHVEFDHLMVTEHHKVRCEWDGLDAEKKYDGFLLASSHGHEMANQYPVAGYSQLSDSANYLFKRYFPAKDQFKNWFESNPNTPFEYRLLTNYLDNLKQGIHDREQETGLTDEDKRVTEVLKEHLDAVIAQYEQEFNKKITFSQCELTEFWVSKVEDCDGEGEVA